MDDLTAGLIEWVDLIEAGIGTPAHTPPCVSRALGMARENGARDLATQLEWVAVWERDGGLANYGACTCDRPAHTVYNRPQGMTEG